MIVVDTNVLVATVIAGERSAEAKRLLAIDREWRLPVFWRAEFCNVLATMVRAGRRLPEEATISMMSALELFCPGELELDQSVVLALAMERSLSGYDAAFLAVALELGVPLITEDAALRRKAGSMAYSLAEYLAEPDGFFVSDASLKPYPKKAPPRRRSRS